MKFDPIAVQAACEMVAMAIAVALAMLGAETYFWMKQRRGRWKK